MSTLALVDFRFFSSEGEYPPSILGCFTMVLGTFAQFGRDGAKHLHFMQARASILKKCANAHIKRTKITPWCKKCAQVHFYERSGVDRLAPFFVMGSKFALILNLCSQGLGGFCPLFALGVRIWAPGVGMGTLFRNRCSRLHKMQVFRLIVQKTAQKSLASSTLNDVNPVDWPRGP